MQIEIPKRIKQKSVYFKNFTIFDLSIIIIPCIFIMNSFKKINDWKVVAILSIPLILVIIWLMFPSGNGTKRNYELVFKMWNHILDYFRLGNDFIPDANKLKKNKIREERYEQKKEQRKK